MDVTTLNVIVAALAGFLGSLITAPITALVTSFLKRDEIELQHRLDTISKQRELFLEHKLELARQQQEQKNTQTSYRDIEIKLSRVETEIETVFNNHKQTNGELKHVISKLSATHNEIIEIERKFKELDNKVQPALFVNARVDLLEKKVYTNG